MFMKGTGEGKAGWVSTERAREAWFQKLFVDRRLVFEEKDSFFPNGRCHGTGRQQAFVLNHLASLIDFVRLIRWGLFR